MAGPPALPTPTASSSSRAPVDTRGPKTQSWAEPRGPGGAFLLFPGSWLASGSENKSDAGEVGGEGGARRKNDFFNICAVNHPPAQIHFQGVWCPGPNDRPLSPPPDARGRPGTGAVGGGDTEREKCPHSKNMSTNSKWTPGCSPPFKGSFSPSATAGAALPLASASKTLAPSSQKQGMGG